MFRPATVLLALVLPAAAELTATFTSGDATDERRDRLPAIRVAEGDAPTPFLAPGPFEVTWTGQLVVAERQRLNFSFEGEGSATLSIAGEEVLNEEGELGAGQSERLRLNPGEHEFSLTYKSKPDGSGAFRVFWEERSFPRQSIPPTAFASAEKSASGKRLGRELFASHHCSKCHLPTAGLGNRPMAEMLEIALLLAATGSRLNEDWIAEWIAAPQELRPGTEMPAMVDPTTEEGRQQAADLAAWLVTFKIGEPPEAPDPQLAQKGGEHFHRFGCVACHSRPDSAETAPGQMPLDRVAQKFQPGALVDFLKKPEQWAPHTGMPNFMLSDEEAESIAAWVLQASASVDHEKRDMPEGDATRGAALSAELNCGACHAGLPLDTAKVPSLEAIFEKDWASEGCLTAHQAAGGFPEYHFTEEQAKALVDFSKTGADSLKRHVPAEYASRKLHSLRCDACHAIDRGRPMLEDTYAMTEDLVAHVVGEDEKLDQSRPHLTFIGEMLHASYIEDMLDGTYEVKPRPWLDMRMPAYPSFAKQHAEGLALLHGVIPDGPQPFEPDPELAEIGALLAGAEGFGCNTCHGAGDLEPTAAFEVQGINFDLGHLRMRKEWYMRWMDEPRSVTPNTKMPDYSENGESQRTDILDGDAAKQFDAIWHYIMGVSR